MVMVVRQQLLSGNPRTLGRVVLVPAAVVVDSSSDPCFVAGLPPALFLALVAARIRSVGIVERDGWFPSPVDG